MAYLDLRTRSKSNEILFVEFNLKLERGVKQSCDLCRTPYTVFKKQHICKRCYRSVCAECSPFKVKTYLANRSTRLHRNCTVCNAESVKIQQYIQENKLTLCKDSDLMFIWSKALSDRKGVKVSRSKSNMRSFINLENLWSSFNFSFREFVGRLVEMSSISDADLLNMISNGLQQIQHFYKDKLREGLYIYIFFLCHADVEVSVNLTIYMLQLIQKSTLNKSSLKKLMQGTGFSQVEMYKLEELILQNAEILKDSVSINVLPITTTFQIVNNAILSKNINFMWKGYLLLFFQRKEVVLKNLNKISIILLELLKNPNIVNFKNQLKLHAEASNSEECQIRYSKLLKEYQFLLMKHQRLQRQSQSDKTIKNKILSDSILSEESSTSILNNATKPHTKFKPEEFNQILQGKNEQIIRLKMRNEQLQLSLKEKKQQCEAFSVQNIKLKVQLDEKDKNLQKLEQQKSQLKVFNTQLIEKMKELSKILMKQEQQEMQKSEEVFEVIKQKYSELQQGKKEQCNIY